MIKKIQTELIFFILLIITVFFTKHIDVEIYNYFSELKYGVGEGYLKLFFINITELGDSLWYFLIFFLVFLISFFAKKINLISIKNYYYLRNFSLFSFIYLLLTGVITQIIKHLVGRTRPNHFNLDEAVFFKFFTTNSAFHSFPSGHSSTIIAITLILCLVLPSLRFYLYIFGSIVAISRVVVGAHYITDVIAGAIIAIIVFKLLKIFYKKIFPEINLGNFKIKNITNLSKVVIIFVIIGIFLTIGPELDVFLSSLFYYNNNQFMIQSHHMVSIIFRKVLLLFLIIYVFILPILSKFFPIHKIFFNYKFSYKEIIFTWFSGLVTLVLFVNVILKDMWGRTRPNDILFFEGKDGFTPWYKFGDSCLSNCSFVSGDASVGYFLIIFYFIMKKNIYCYLALFFGTFIGLIRIIAGGHFFSDIIFSQIIIIGSLSILFILYTKLYAK